MLRTAPLLLAAAAAAQNDGVYDYVVVGAGAAGCPLAAKLAKANYSVLLLEAGHDNDWKARDLDPLVPYQGGRVVQSPELDDHVVSEPVWKTDRDYVHPAVPHDEPLSVLLSNLTARRRSGSSQFMPRARVVGGCTMHNNMIFLRGSPEIYDSWGRGWAERGGSRWAWRSVLPKFVAMENVQYDGDAGFHGSSGECRASFVPLTAADRALIAAANATGNPGLATNNDLNGATRVGFGPFPSSISNSATNATRWSSGQAFLTQKVRALPNFHLRTEAMATRIVFNGTRAVGVEYTANGTARRVRARREVLLSAGAFRSPQLLMLSGVGPAGVLRNHSIPAVAVNEGVGRNLQDHLMTNVRYASKRSDYPSSAYTGVPYGGFWYSSWCKARNCSHPDMQFMCGSSGQSAQCLPSLVGSIQYAPGFLTLNTTDPTQYPLIYPNYFGAQNQSAGAAPVPTGPYYPDYVPAQADIDRLVEGIRVARTVFEANSTYFYRSLGPRGTSDSDLAAYVMNSATTIYHPVGTCKMGDRQTDRLAVVDAALRVYGAEGLRVVDASIMPTITNVNTDYTSRMIGFHAADIILEGMQ